MKPLLLIDVDGVLNVDRRTSLREPITPGFQKYRVRTEGSNWTLYLAAEHGEWLRSLMEDFDLVWCTTWWRTANAHMVQRLNPAGIVVSTELNPRFWA